MAHGLLPSLLIDQIRTLRSSGFLFQNVITHSVQRQHASSIISVALRGRGNCTHAIISVLVQKTHINPISIVQNQGIIGTKYFITLGKTARLSLSWIRVRGGGVLPYMGYIGMCCCEGYGV